MEFFLVFLAGMAASVLLLRWAINRAIDRMLERMAREDDEDTVVSDAEKMELKVEFDRDIYFCYNVTDGAFVCQGTDLAEIRSNFRSRFPGVDAVIVDGDDHSVSWLKTEMSKSNEDSSSIRPTS
jgi:hypothetical protein